MGVVGWGERDWGMAGVRDGVSKLGEGGRGARWVGWVQARVCVELNEGGAVSDAFVLEFVCVYRTPLF